MNLTTPTRLGTLVRPSIRPAPIRREFLPIGLVEIDEPTIALIEERESRCESLCEFVAGDAEIVWPAFVKAGGLMELIERHDLRLVLAACLESPRNPAIALRLAYRALRRTSLIDESIQPSRRGVLWSKASLRSCWAAQRYPRREDAIEIATRLIDIDARLSDARDSILFARARLIGAA